jgi:hypothetical protein
LDNIFSNPYFGAVKELINILVLLFLFPAISYSQLDNTNRIYNSDSLNLKINSNPLTEIQLKFDEFELHREFKNIKTKIQIDGDPETVWLRTSLAISNTDASGSKDLPYFLSPLYAQYIEDSKFNPIRYVLGMAQLSAVGYLAYRHIKKYGFLK